MNRKLVASLVAISLFSAICPVVQAADTEKKKATVVKVVLNTGGQSTLKKSKTQTTKTKTISKSATETTTENMTVGAKKAAAARAKAAETAGKKNAEASKTSAQTATTVGAKKAASVGRVTGTKEETKSVGKTKDTASVMTKGSQIEVGLLVKQREVKIAVLGEVKAKVGGKEWQTYKKGMVLVVTAGNRTISINGKKAGETVLLSPSGDAISFKTKGHSYRGSMKLIASGSGVTCVNVLPLEQYLCGVVPCEVSPSWHRDALRAQAVAARTYAIYHKDGYRQNGYDVTDDTYSQVYEGADAEDSATTAAIKDTAGMIVTYNGKAIDAVFHANGGGATENSENVWGSVVPYLKGVKEVSHSVIDKAWTKKVPLETFQKNLGIGTFKSLSLSKLTRGKSTGKDRGVSGRVLSFTVKGAKKEVTTTGDKMQALYDLPSTLFDIKVSGKEVVFTGYGLGHGLGLSQWGAQAMAQKNGGAQDYYKKILMHYYKNTKITKVY